MSGKTVTLEFNSAVLNKAGWLIAVAACVTLYMDYSGKLNPSPNDDTDPAVVKAARSYGPELAKAYSGPWSDGADALEDGKSMSDSLAVVAKSWDSARSKLFDRELTPRFSKIFPESSKEDMTSSERRDMVKAWRSLAKGFGGK